MMFVPMRIPRCRDRLQQSHPEEMSPVATVQTRHVSNEREQPLQVVALAPGYCFEWVGELEEVLVHPEDA